MLYLAISTFVVSLLITALVRKYAYQLRLTREPNHRSSHTKITPHGGGLGIVAGTIFFTLWLFFQNNVQYWVYGFTSVLAILIAAKGLIDDIYHLAPKIRLLIQIIASCSLVVIIQSIPIPGFEPILNLPMPLTIGFILFASLWWLNLFNFMDGIDGLAACQAIFMLLSAALLIALKSPELVNLTLWQWIIYLAIAVLGFLTYNWPPAKIFMGDVGSSFLAFMLLVIALTTISLHWMNYATWAILGTLFISDASITLLRRMLTGQNWLEAHRTHAYQRLARRWQSHKRVTLSFITINLIWSLPLAYVSLNYPDSSWLFLLIAYLPIITLVILLGAGRPEN
ncbi:glycosyltransferase family 4 protein [uncultured Thiothrix sp.]|uniref:MraY family glycosyltransferase n=1 Tax=uncultured Thiothrix sp. TaxID=223185 RepID=UPI00263224ED|nr:glycosyltransferase family 4 protein [uncultured Thiothrix sp.]